MPVPDRSDADADDAAAELAAAVLAHPGVARLDGGPFGTVASFLPGRRRIDGVRIGIGRRAGRAGRRRAARHRRCRSWPTSSGAIVRGVCGPVAVEVTFSDVVPGRRGRPAAAAVR